MKKIRNLLAICAITVVSLISTGCSGKDVTVYMDGDTPKCSYENIVDVSGDSTNVEEHYNVYEINGEKYYSRKSDQYRITEIPESIDLKMDGETLYLDNVQTVSKIKMKNKDIVDKQIKVVMNGPIAETNGQVDPSNPNTVFFECPSSLDTIYAYTQKAKNERETELKKVPTISANKIKKWYIEKTLSETKLELKNPSKLSEKYFVYINGNKAETYEEDQTVSLEDFYNYIKVGTNKIYLINDLGVKSNVIEVKFDYPYFVTNQVLFFCGNSTKDVVFYTRSGVKSIKIGKKNINVKKVKKAKKKYRYKIPAKYIKKGKTLKIKTKSGDTIKCKL